jgi:hypothetical protein
LQEEEQQMLADVDELRQRMDQPQNQSRMQEERQQLDRTRQDVQRAADGAQQGSPSQALAAGTRAERQLQQMRDQMRRDNSSQFADDLREMRNQARELARQQDELVKKIEAEANRDHRTLSDSPERKEMLDQLARQRQLMTNLVASATEVSQQAEEPEPLLSRQLYDTVRKFAQDTGKDVKEVRDKLSNNGLLTQNLDDQLQQTTTPDGAKLTDITSEMLRLDFLPPAHETAVRSRSSLDDLRRGVERAAQSVIGDDTDALRAAKDELNQLTEQLQREITEAGNTNQLAQAGNTNQLAAASSRRSGDRNNQANRGQAGRNGQPNDGTQDPNQSSDANNGNRNSDQANNNDSQGSDQQSGSGQRAGQRAGQQSGQRSGAGGQGQNGEQQNQSQQNAEENQGLASGQNGQGGQTGQNGQDSQNNSEQLLTQSDQTSPDQAGQRAGNGRRGGRAANGGARSGAGGNYGGYGGDWANVVDQMLNRDSDVWRGPLTGEDFVPWSDGLRNVEEMIEIPTLRNDVAVARDRARVIRQDYKRTGKSPDWAVVQLQIVKPLVEVRDRISDELARRESQEALVPLDRDPVPSRYSDLVRKYYEELGKDK